MDFDWIFYIEYYRDLPNNGITTYTLALRHWNSFGKKEGRICVFPYKNYILNNPDLVLAGITTYNQAFNHWNSFGKKGGRLCELVHKNEIINILIRTTYRPTFFKECIESILDQKYKNYRIICCYDDERCLDYLKDYENKLEYFYIEIESNVSYKYNLYCNVLMEKVNDGWIMGLDDDDKFSNENALTIINSKLRNVNDILFWQVNIAGNIIIPPNINNIRLSHVANCGFCFHSKVKNMSRWSSVKCGDFHFLNNLLQSKYQFNRLKLPITLTQTIHNNIFGNQGKQIEYPFQDFIKHKNIKQIYVSNSFIHLKDRILKIFDLREYDNININEPCVFFGVYANEDYQKINKHGGKTYVMFGGSDVPNYRGINAQNYLAISNNIKNRLLKDKKFTRLIYFNIVDKTIFKPVVEKGDKIFIYDGIRKKADNAIIYGKLSFDLVKKHLPQFEYIHSSDLNLPYEKMPDVYKKCFIGLRLTPRDGNANMVQEMETMEIPVVHNHSRYGLKWKNAEDVINWIIKYKKRNIVNGNIPLV